MVTRPRGSGHQDQPGARPRVATVEGPGSPPGDPGWPAQPPAASIVPMTSASGTDRPFTPPPTGPPPPGYPPPGGARRPLLRSRDDRVVAGVCAGLGTWLDIDPVVLRVLLAVLTLFGGAGLVLYAVGWVLIPQAGAPASPANQWFARQDLRHPTAAAVLVLVGVAAVLAVLVHLDTDTGVILATIAVLAFLVVRGRHAGPRPQGPPPGWYAGPPGRPGAPGQPGVSFTKAGAAGAGPFPGPETPPAYGSPAYGSPAYGPWVNHPWSAGPVPPVPARPLVPPVAPREPRPRVGRVVASVSLLAVGVALLLDRLDAVHVTPFGALALALTVVGVGLLVGAFVGRAVGMVLIGALMTVALVLGSWTHSRFGAGGAHTVWTPASLAAQDSSYAVGAGQGRLDLTGVGAGLAGHTVHAHVDSGRLVVVVPNGVPVDVTAHDGAGSIRLFGGEHGGLGVDDTFTDPDFTTATGLTLNVWAGVGVVEVDRG